MERAVGKFATMATISRISTTPTATAARIRDRLERPSALLLRRFAPVRCRPSPPGGEGAAGDALIFLLGTRRRLLEHRRSRVWRLPCRTRSAKAPSSCVVRTLGQGPVQHLEQPAGIELEAGRAKLQRLPAVQLDQAVRQLVGIRHPRPIHQDRDHPNLARQGSLDLEPNEIIGVVKATPAMLIGDRSATGHR